MRLAEATHLANDEQADFIADLVLHALGGSVEGRTIALWGLAFKPETDDIREAPSLKLARALLARGARVRGHDPEAGPNFRAVMGDAVTISERDYDALDGAHALVLLTEWRSYRAPNFAEIRRRLVNGAHDLAPVLVDARNVWRAWDVLRAGLRYQGVGVPSTKAPDRRSRW